MDDGVRMMQTLRTSPVDEHAGGETEIEIEIDVEPEVDSQIDREIQAVLDDLTEWVEESRGDDPRRTDRYRCVPVARPS